MKNKRYILYVAVAIVSLIAGLYSPPLETRKKSDYSFLENSMLEIVQNLHTHVLAAEKNEDLTDVDLEISRVAIKKKSDPIENFNYYVYEATLLIENKGQNLRNINAYVSTNSGQDFLFLKNSANGFSLKSGETYALRGYEVRFDGRYNGGEVLFELHIDEDNIFEKNLENNRYAVEVKNHVPALKNLRVSEIDENGAFVLDAKVSDFAIGDKEYLVYFSDNLEYATGDEEYLEVYKDGNIFGYGRITLTETVIGSGNWKEVVSPELNKLMPVQVYKDPFDAKGHFYVCIKAVNKKNGYYKVSDILHFAPNKKINRAQFAKIFTESAGISVDNDLETHYEDVVKDSWYGPYVAAMYNMGLTDVSSFSFNPSRIVSREDALKTVLDFYDVDIIGLKALGNRFKDIKGEDLLYPYAQALKAQDKAQNLAHSFARSRPATEKFVKYLIDEYRKRY